MEASIQEGLRLCHDDSIFSPDALKSRNVTTEWQYFFDAGKPIIPIICRSVAEEEIHFQIRRIQRIDFQLQNFNVAYRQLIREFISTNIGQTVVQGYPSSQTASSASRRSILFARILLAFLIVLGSALLASSMQSMITTPTEISQTTIAEIATSTLTVTPELTNTETPDLNFLAAQTRIARVTQAQQTINAYTDTPTSTFTETPNIEFTLAAIVFATDAQETTIAQASFTKTYTPTPSFTPSNTSTLTPTHTFTPSSTQTATKIPLPTLTPMLEPTLVLSSDALLKLDVRKYSLKVRYEGIIDTNTEISVQFEIQVSFQRTPLKAKYIIMSSQTNGGFQRMQELPQKDLSAFPFSDIEKLGNISLVALDGMTYVVNTDGTCVAG
ncbi:MAG: hypothetical protein U0528_07605, partial [Anaerolineae bacterium]